MLLRLGRMEDPEGLGFRVSGFWELRSFWRLGVQQFLEVSSGVLDEKLSTGLWAHV